MNMRTTLLILLISGSLTAERWLNISNFNSVNSIVRLYNLLYVGTEGGVFIYDLLSRKIENTLVTERGVSLAVPDPSNGDVFFISSGKLYKWIPYVSSYIRLFYVGSPKSISADFNYIYIDFGAEVKRYTKNGISQGSVSPPEGLNWCGERSNLDKEDDKLLFFAPYFRYVEGLGKVDYRIFYPYMDKLWIGTDGIGVIEFDIDTREVLDSIYFGINFKEVKAIHLAGKSIWIGGKGGITVKRANAWRSFGEGGGLALRCLDVNSISGDDKTVWFGTGCGLLRYRDNRFWNFRLPIGMNDYVTSVLDDGERVWIGTEEGIAYFLSGGIEKIPNSEDIYVYKILKGTEGVYFLTQRGVVVYYPSNEEWGVLNDSKNWLTGDIKAGDRNGIELIFASSNGLVFYSETEGEYSYLPYSFSSVGNPVIAMEVDSKGIYLGTPSGLYIYRKKGKIWRHYTEGTGRMVSNYVEAILSTEEGVYIGTKKGLSILSE